MPRTKRAGPSVPSAALSDRPAGSNGSTPITAEGELDAAKQARGEAPAERRGKRGEMRRGGRGGPRHHAMRMLRQADADGDKTVTRAEFDAAIEARFAKVDSDGSGTITAEERKAAMATMKERMQERRGKWRERRGQPES